MDMSIKVSSFHRYLVKRLVYIVFTLFSVSFIVFSVTQLLPGNAATMILGTHATEEKIRNLEQQLNLHLPWYEQYFRWILNILAGDWGTSFVLEQPVEEIVQTRFMRSAQLAIVTLLLTTLIGIPIGVIAAIERDTFLDSVLSSVSYLGISIPEFVMGNLLILLFAGPVFQILPSGGYAPPSDGVIAWLRSLALPAISLTILLLAHIMRQTRSSMIETLQSEYVRTARLKGLPESLVIVKHALRNGLLPTITVLALDLGYLMGSIVVIEEVFAYPGLGRLIVFAIQNRDLPTLQMAIIVVAAVYAFANFGADILYTKLNPRIDYGGN